MFLLYHRFGQSSISIFCCHAIQRLIERDEYDEQEPEQPRCADLASAAQQKGQPRQGHTVCWSLVGLQFSFLWKSDLSSTPPKPDGIYTGILDLTQLSRVLVAL
jgi:hypothetical protein